MAEIMVETKAPAAEPRKRGRPRTITDDQQVPERRRKQLRVAQQAYRKRKETTINNLQTRVEELESGIEKLSQSFLSFSNLLLGENVLQYRPRITSALQGITQQCVLLAQQGCSDSEQNAPEETVAGETSKQRTPTEGSVNRDYDSEINELSDVIQSGRSASTSSSPPVPVLSQFLNSSPPPALSQWMDVSLPLTPPDYEQVMPSFDSFFSESTIPMSLPNPGLTVSPANIMNQRQWSLSHRIVRECSYNGYKLLVYSPHDSAKIQAVFGSLLTESQLDWSIKGLYSALVDEVGDTVDSRSKVLSPSYPMRDVISLDQLEQTPGSWQTIPDLSVGDAGEWLDASGVQKLVQEKGIDIQPDSSQSCGFRVRPHRSLDVATFIKIISRDCICIGPGPAFERKTVERALLQATQSNGPWSYTPLRPMPD